MKLNLLLKIAGIFTIIIALIFGTTYLYLNSHLKQHTYQRIRSNLLEETTLTKTLLEKHILEQYQSYDLDEIADEIGKDLGVRVTIIDLGGTVIGDSELQGEKLKDVENHLYRIEVQDALDTGYGESRRFSTTINKDLLYIAQIFGRDEPQGIIRLSIPLSEIDEISNRLKQLLLISFLAAFILAVLVSFAASTIVTKPITEMSRIAQSIARGDFSRRISVSTNDEIGDLAKSFNYMSEQIRLRIAEVTTNKSRLEAVLLSMFEGIMVADSSDNIILMNQTLKDFFQIKDEPIGKKPLEIIRNIEIQELVDRALRLRQGVETKEISIIQPHEKVLLIHAAPIIREGKTEGAVLVFHDITELRHLERIRQDFVANVSHELRTPVSNIKGYAETLLEGALDDKKNAKDFINVIHSDSERLAKLISDLLDLSKIESGKMKMNMAPCAIEPIIDRIISGLKKSAEEKSITVKKDIPKEIPKALVDESAIAQVILNLLDNAIKYTPEGGLITISVIIKNGFIKINVNDTGIGIPERDLPRIFERFYRVDRVRSRELGGTGLGLSIVKHIVQAHKGEVSVESILAGGSTFSFTLPRS